MRTQRLGAGLVVVPLLLPIGLASGEEPTPELKEKIGGAIRSEIEGAGAIENKTARALILRILGQTQVGLGDREQARATLKQALKETLDDFDADAADIAALCAVARALGELGDQSDSRAGFRKALEAAEKAENHGLEIKDRAESAEFGRYLKSKSLLRIAQAQARAGDSVLARETFARALALAEALKDERKTIDELCKIAAARRKAGDREGADETFDRAIQLTETLKFDPRKEAEPALPAPPPRPPKPGEVVRMPDFPDPRSPREVLRDIVIARLGAVDDEGAIRALENSTIKGKFDGWDLDKIAGAIKPDDRDGAAKVLEKVRKLAGDFGAEDEFDRFRVLEGVARTEARLGQFDEATRTAGDIGRGARIPEFFRGMRIKALLAIARAEVRADAVAPARKRLREAFDLATADSKLPIRFPRMPDEIGLEAIAKAQAQAGDVEGAERSIAALPEAGADAEKAGDAPDEIRQFARELGQLRRGDALAALAAAQAVAGDRPAASKTLRKALEIAGKLTEEFHRHRLLQAIATAQATAGDLDAALQTAATIDRDFMSQAAIMAMIDARLKARDVTAAHRLADGLDADFLRQAALVKIAVVEAQAGDAAEALRWTTRLDSAVARAQALANIVKGLNRRAARDAAPQADPESDDDGPLGLELPRPPSLPGMPDDEDES